jgi:hypothetical protein
MDGSVTQREDITNFIMTLDCLDSFQISECIIENGMKAWKRFDRFEFPPEDSNHSVDDPLPSKIEDPIFSGDSPKMGSEIRQSDGTIPDLSMSGALSDLRSLGLLSEDEVSVIEFAQSSVNSITDTSSSSQMKLLLGK